MALVRVLKYTIHQSNRIVVRTLGEKLKHDTNIIQHLVCSFATTEFHVSCMRENLVHCVIIISLTQHVCRVLIHLWYSEKKSLDIR